MGSVLGTCATRDEHIPTRRSFPGAPLSRREYEQSAEAAGDAVMIKNDAVEVNRQTILHTGDFPVSERRRPPPEYSLKTAQGWPSWFCSVTGDATKDWAPRAANTFEKLDKVGQGMYSNVYKARVLLTGKIVGLKKVRFDNLEPESVKFIAREILILKKLNHPNIIKLEGLVTVLCNYFADDRFCRYIKS